MRYTSMLFSLVFANQTLRRSTSLAPAAARPPHSRHHDDNSLAVTPFFPPLLPRAESRRTNFLTLQRACSFLCFHTVTNCPFSIPFLLTFMHRMGGVGGTPNLPTCEPSNLAGPISFRFTLLRTLLYLRKTQLVSFQAIPHSLLKTPGGGGRGALLPSRAPSRSEALLLTRASRRGGHLVD
jgi:hypothetical protein